MDSYPQTSTLKIGLNYYDYKVPSKYNMYGKKKSYIVMVLLVLYYSSLMCDEKKKRIELSLLRVRKMLKH